MMINQTKYHWLMALPALLLAVGCSESILPEGQDTGVAELQVSPQVVLTRGAIDAGSDASAVGTVLGSIAVYANSKTTNKKTNNYGLYTYNSSAWIKSIFRRKRLRSMRIIRRINRVVMVNFRVAVLR